MALTSRASNTIVTTSYFNDYYNLLTGVMKDQNITIAQTVSLKNLATSLPTAPSLSLASGGGLAVGAYTYAISYAAVSGTSQPGTTAVITTTSGNQRVNLASIPIGPAGTTSRKIWRGVSGGTVLYLVTTISDNTTTSYLDLTPDGSLVTLAPTTDSLGGTLYIYNRAGTVSASITSDGTVLGNSYIAATGTTGGFYIYNNAGLPRQLLYIDSSNDPHLLTTPTNHKFRISKDDASYDIAVFDASGSTGVTTLNGNLTLSGSTSTLTCYAVNATSITYSGGAAFTGLTSSGTIGITANATKITFIDSTLANSAACIYNNNINEMVYQSSTANRFKFLANNGTTEYTRIDSNGLSVNTNNITLGNTWSLQFKNAAGTVDGAIREDSSGNVIYQGGAGSSHIFYNSGSTKIISVDNSGLTVYNQNITMSNTKSIQFENSAGTVDAAIREDSGGNLIYQGGAASSHKFYDSGSTDILNITSSGTTFNCGNITITSGTVEMTSGDLLIDNGNVYVGSSGHSGSGIYFNAGNNGAIRNPSGGALDLTSGGSGSINFWDGKFGTLNGSIDSNGMLTANKFQMSSSNGSLTRYKTWSTTCVSTSSYYSVTHGTGATVASVGALCTSTGTGGQPVPGLGVINLTTSSLQVAASAANSPVWGFCLCV
jgi:hypothetical protein